MARLFLIRHGEPEAAWGGADDDPGLSDQGRSQAVAAARFLLPLGPLAVFSSPMRRCRETAAPYEQMAGCAAVIEPRVSEVPTPPGILDRRAWLQDNFPWRSGAVRSWSTLEPALLDWREAMLAWALTQMRDAAVFSHFIAINVLASAAIGRDQTIVCRPDYASVTELETSSGGLRLVRHGVEMQAGELR